jgi:hypothetical protein
VTTPTDPTTSSRRALLAGSAGALAALVADAIARPRPARAAGDGTHVELGGANSDTTLTSITNTTTDGTAFEAYGNRLGTGVYGESQAGCGVRGRGDQRQGVWGTSYYGSGVLGESVQPTGAGVSGSSNFGWGVFAHSAGGKPAIGGWSKGDNTGMLGHSGSADPPGGPAKTGVYGIATQDAGARGVTGESTSGRGVNGIATSGTGVHGAANGGEGVRGTSADSNGVAGESASSIASGVIGVNTAGGFGTYGRSNSVNGAGVFGEALFGTAVYGYTDSGVGIHAFAQASAGTALKAEGRVSFSTSGLATASPGQRSITVAPGTDLGNGSRILCTLESNQAGLFIHRTTKSAEANTFRVFLSAAVASGKSAKVAWFVIG